MNWTIRDLSVSLLTKRVEFLKQLRSYILSGTRKTGNSWFRSIFHHRLSVCWKSSQPRAVTTLVTESCTGSRPGTLRYRPVFDRSRDEWIPITFAVTAVHPLHSGHLIMSGSLWRMFDHSLLYLDWLTNAPWHGILNHPASSAPLYRFLSKDHFVVFLCQNDCARFNDHLNCNFTKFHSIITKWPRSCRCPNHVISLISFQRNTKFNRKNGKGAQTQKK